MFVRSLGVISISVALSSCATTFSTNARSPNKFTAGEVCSIISQTNDSRQVQCQIPNAEFTRKLKFKANFSGGHDDTRARIEPYIDKAPLNCDEGSKTNLFGEDGDVSLWCTFSIIDHPHSNGIFTVTVWWSHAEYTNYEVTDAERRDFTQAKIIED